VQRGISGREASLLEASRIPAGALVLSGIAPELVLNAVEIGAGTLVIVGPAPNADVRRIIRLRASVTRRGVTATVGKVGASGSVTRKGRKASVREP
jgi:hypothetical protein